MQYFKNSKQTDKKDKLFIISYIYINLPKNFHFFFIFFNFIYLTNCLFIYKYKINSLNKHTNIYLKHIFKINSNIYLKKSFKKTIKFNKHLFFNKIYLKTFKKKKNYIKNTFLNFLFFYEKNLFFIKKKSLFNFLSINLKNILYYKIKKNEYLNLKKKNVFFFQKEINLNLLKFKKTFFTHSFLKTDNFIIKLKKKSNKKKKVFNKILFVKKYFKRTKRDALNTLIKKFYYKNKNKKNFFHFLKKIENKNFFQINNIFQKKLINFFSLFFFYMNKNYIEFILKKKMIYINFKLCMDINMLLKYNDFFQLIFIKNLFKLILYWKKKQRKYIYIISQKLKKLRNTKKKTHNRNFTKNFPVAFKKLIALNKKIPAFIELDYMTLSFFFLKKKNLYIHNFNYFNPFLFKLLKFK